MYLYTGVADVAGYTGDEGFITAMNRLWKDVVERKMYITGGIGARHQGEAFGDPYELPNDSAYCETCAAIGLALWSHRLNLLHADAQYADVMERVIYNGVLAGIGMDGEHFFYVNPLASGGNHHRQPFYPCACCPTNVVRFLPSLPGYVYARSADGIYVNLYVAGQAEIPWQQSTISLRQQTEYPWDGQIKLTVTPQAPTGFALRLRIPGWCDGAKVAVNDQEVKGVTIEKGYAVLQRQWQLGDTVTLSLPMPVRRIEANPRVRADWGRVALQRGPLVYCAEAVDNGGRVGNLVLERAPSFATKYQSDLLGGVVVINGQALGGRQVTTVPYYAWDHREPGEMSVWIRQDGKPRHSQPSEPGWDGKLYRPLDPSTLGPSEPLSLMDTALPSASHCYANDSVQALADSQSPESSHDQSIPRFTWWDHRGTTEWVQYSFDQPATVHAVEVYWFDDRPQGGCRLPDSWRLLYQRADAWQEVPNASGFDTSADQFNRVTFDAVKTTVLRLEVKLQDGFSGGILQWNVE